MRQRIFLLLTLVPLILFSTTAFAQMDPGIPDTVRVDTVVVDDVSTDVALNIPVEMSWDEGVDNLGIMTLNVPLWVMSGDVIVNGADFTGGFAENAGMKGFTAEPSDPQKGNIWSLVLSPTDLFVGDTTYQLYANLQCTVPAGTQAQCVTIDTAFAAGNALLAVDMMGVFWTPQFIPGAINILGGCDQAENLPPEITCPNDVTVDIGQLVDLAITATDDGLPDPPAALTMTAEDVPGFLTFTDNGGGNASLTGTPGCGDPGVYVVRIIVSDGELADTCYVTVTVNDDTEDPVITCGSDVTVGTDPGVCDAVVDLTGHTTATDNCPGVVVSFAPASGSTFPLGTTQVTATATDAAGNAVTCNFNVIVEDDEDPIITCGSDVTVGTDPGQCDAGVDLTGHTTATDNCPGVTVSYAPASGSTFPEGTTQVTATATDAAGNAVTCNFNVIVEDNEDPVITCGSDVTVGNDPDQCNAVVNLTGHTTATDNCPGVAVSYAPASGSTFPVGTTQVTATATDAAGNTATCTFDVIVEDTENPVITCPADITIAPTDPTDPSFTGEATATDNCGIDVINYSDVETTPEQITRVWEAIDINGLTDPCTQIITITAGNQPPVITCPAPAEFDIGDLVDLAITATDDGLPDPPASLTMTATGVPGFLTFTDNGGGNASLAGTPGCGDDGQYTINVTADDGELTADCDVVITVAADGVNPVITCGNDVTVNSDPGQCDAVVNLTGHTTATDNCPGVVVSYAPASGSTFPVGTTQVTATATDAAGNTATCNFNVIVEDNEDPVVTCPVNMTVDVDPDECYATVTYSATATDNCPGVMVTYTPPSGSTFNEGTTTTVEVTATDANSNSVTCYFDVTVNPVPDAFAAVPSSLVFNYQLGSTLPGDQPVNIANTGCGPLDYMTGADEPWILVSPPTGTTPSDITVGVNVTGLGEGTYNGNVIISEGISAQVGTIMIPVTLNVVGEQNLPPEITCPNDTTLYVGIEAILSVSATDANGDPITLSVEDASGEPIPPHVVFVDNGDGTGTFTVTSICTDIGTHTARFIASDGELADTCYTILTIEDNEAPVVTCPADITVGNDQGQCGANVNFSATATDNCTADPTITYKPPPDSFFDIGLTPVEVVAVDASGNADTCYFNITVEDTEDPVLTCPVGEIVIDPLPGECFGAFPSPVTATDNCPGVTVTYDPSDTTYDEGTTTTVTATATDAAGNSVQCSYDVTVNPVPDEFVANPTSLTFNYQIGGAVPPAQPVNITNTGCGELAYIVGSDAPWLLFDPPEGITPSDVMVSVNIAGLAPGVYNGNIIISEGFTAAGVGLMIPVTLNVTEEMLCADSCWVGHETGTVGSTVGVPVTFKNCDQLGGIAIPLWWNPGVVTLESIDFTGSRVDYLAMKSDASSIDNDAQTVMLFAVVMAENPIPAGEGLMATLNFHINECSDEPVIIDTAFIPPTGFYVFADMAGAPIPTAFMSGSITVESGPLTITVEPEALEFDICVGKTCPPCQTLNISTDFCKPAEFSLAIVSGSEWLSVDPSTGPLPGQVEVCVDITGLPPGTYTDSICVLASQLKAMVDPCLYVPVTLEICGDPALIRLDNGYFPFNVTNCAEGSTDGAVLNITNAGGGVLNWQADWTGTLMDVAPPSGTAPSALTISVDGMGHAAGVYEDTIFITSPEATNSPQMVLVVTTVTDCEPGDTVWVGHSSGGLGDDVVIPVTFANSLPLSGLTVPLIYSSDHVVAVSGDFTGSRVDYLSQKLVTIDEAARTICIAAIPVTEDPIPPGKGQLVNLHFTVISTNGCPDPVVVDIDSNYIPPGCEFMFTDLLANPLIPEFFPGSITIECGPAGGISGIIEDEQGQGLDGCVEVWTSYPDGQIVGTDCAGGDGNFDVPGIPDGNYDVRAIREGYCTVVLEDVTSPTSGLVIVMIAIPEPAITPYVADYWGTQSTLFGVPLQPGDVITATDPDGVICGVTYVETAGQYSIHVYGDDEEVTPGIDEGAVEGDQITLWLNCDCPHAMENLWVDHGFFEEDVNFECVIGQVIELCDNWTLISYNIELADQTLENVLSSIDGFYQQLFSSTCEGAISWDINRPAGLNDLETMDNSHGYWVYAPGADEITITGTPIAPDTPIDLCDNWSVISYLPNAEDNLGHAWSSIAGDLEFAFGFECQYGARTYDPQRPPTLNDLTCLRPGHGYWVKMANPGTLTYPTSGYSCITPPGQLPKVVNLTNVVQPTPWVCDFWSYGSADGPSKGSVLTVLDEQKTICGQAVVLDGGMFLVHVYGDDPNTEVDEGAANGSKLTFSAGDAVYEISGSDEWTERGSVEISLSRSGNNGQVPNTFELAQNYPNPFNPNTTIRLRMPDEMDVRLTIYNVLGQKVRTLIDGMLSAGEHEVEWDGTYDSGRRAESGVYFYRLSTATFTDVRKMTLLK